jgi:hypothetical protein
MTREDIIRVAREAGLHLYVNDLTEEPYALIVERFANLVAAAERSACAQVCDEIANKPSNVVLGVALDCAAAIRARGEK